MAQMAGFIISVMTSHDVVHIPSTFCAMCRLWAITSHSSTCRSLAYPNFFYSIFTIQPLSLEGMPTFQRQAGTCRVIKTWIVALLSVRCVWRHEPWFLRLPGANLKIASMPVSRWI